MIFGNLLSLFRVLAILVFFFFSEGVYAASERSPLAQEFVSQLPEGALTLDLVLSRGMMTSSSFHVARAPLQEDGADLLLAQALLNTEFSFEGSFVDNQNEATSPVSPISIVNSTLQLKAAKMFSTGTALTTELIHGDGEINFSSFPSSIYNQTKVGVYLSQDLWRDFGGRAIRWQLEAGRSDSEAVVLEVDEASLDWMETFRDLFYSAWLGQEQVLAARQSVQQKKRLLEITRLQLKRGTAESPDVLQVRKAVHNSEVALADAQENLDGLWRHLIVSLNLHETRPEFLSIDPMEVPTKLDEPVQGALGKCLQHPQGKAFRSLSGQIQAKEKRAHAFDLRLKSSKDAIRPDLKLSLGLVTNGVDSDDRGKTFNEAFSADHPYWSLMLTYKTTFEKDAEVGRYRKNLALSHLANADLELAQSNFVLDWLNKCAQLKRWQAKVKAFKSSWQEQKKRMQAEERRFRLGRVPLSNVISADDDATESELNLYNAQVEMRRASWEIHRLTGQSGIYLKGLQGNYEKAH